MPIKPGWICGPIKDTRFNRSGLIAFSLPQDRCRDTLYSGMAVNLLVVSPSPSFGESIRHSLEESDAYHVFIANNKASAVVRADEESCKLAFLDLDLGEQWVEDIGQSLRTVLPEIQLLVLADKETPPALDSIRPWTLVRKPLHTPDLFSVLEAAHLSSGQSTTGSSDPGFPWLNDVAKAAQHLTRLTLESSAQAALITRNGEMWAYAGQLSQPAALEISKTLARNWNSQIGTDLLRFVRLESTKAEHMLYATALAENVLLAMVFDAETPFSTIRSQAAQLVTSFEPKTTKTEPREIKREEKPEKAAWPKAKTLPLQSPEPPADDLENEEEALNLPPISEILKDIPTPDPVPGAQAPRLSANPPASEHPEKPRQPEPEFGQTRPSIFSRESSPPIPLKDVLLAEKSIDLPPAESIENLEVTLPSKSRSRPETPVRPPAPEELDVTRPHTISEAAGRIVLEPVTAGLYHLAYACLLIPRFTSHYLTGDIADRLSEWLPNICIAFGWRLEHLAVRPEYLQWIVNVPPSTSPGYLMRVIRQQTSDKIFTEIPRLKKENPSGDFWAPGYLILGSTQPHPPQLVKDYIKQIRQRQGVEKPRK